MPILTPSQRVDLKMILEDKGFTADEFEMRSNVKTRACETPGEQLTLKDTNYYFSIFFNHSDFNPEKFWLEYSPGEDRLHDYDFSWSWASVCEDFRAYLARLRHELAVADADPWKQPGVMRVIEQRQGQK